MDKGDVVAGRSVRGEQAGSVIGGVLIGGILVTALLVVGEPTTGDVVATLVVTAFYAVVWGVTAGFQVRREWARLQPPPLAHRVARPRLPATVCGVINAVLAGAAASVAVALLVWLTGGRQDLSDSRVLLAFLPGASLGLASSVAIGAGELRRWENYHGVQLHVRVGAPRLTWTRARALRRLVTVAVPGAAPAYSLRSAPLDEHP